MDSDVDSYIGRSQLWADEMTALRPTLLACGLDEDVKWGKPCYSHGGKNIAIMQEMKDFLALMFFKGALLADADGVLEAQGPNSRSARRIRFTSVADVDRLIDAVRTCVAEAIDVEESGAEVGPAPEPVFASELQERLAADAEFRAGFEQLTPGRKREYNLYISGAKQSATRVARVEKYAAKIAAGQGFRDRPAG